MQPNFFVKICSYITPWRVNQVFSEYSREIGLYLYQGQYMLCTHNATYSYGTRYNPFLVAFNYFNKNKIQLPNNFLMLGGGLCSALQILQLKYKHTPTSIVVERDAEVILLAKQVLPVSITSHISFEHQSAQDFVKTNTQLFDTIGIDIFINMTIPAYFTSTEFLGLCKNALQPNGVIIYNAYFDKSIELQHFDDKIRQVFSKVVCLKHDVNSVYILRA